jgi:hypothetical protein
MLHRKDTMLNKKDKALPQKEIIAFRQFSATFPTQIASTFYFSQPYMQPPKKIKRACNPTHGFRPDNVQDVTILHNDPRVRAACNTGFALGGFLVQICKFAILL